MIVADPSFPISTLVPCGNLSLLAFSIASLTFDFSSSVKLEGSFTLVLSGIDGSTLSAIVLSDGFSPLLSDGLLLSDGFSPLLLSDGFSLLLSSDGVDGVVVPPLFVSELLSS